MKKVAFTVSILILLSFLLTACGVGTPQATPTPTQNPDAPVFNITLHSFYFKPDRIKLTVGQKVTFHIMNADIVDHELMIGHNPLRNDKGELGDGFEHDFFALTKPKVTGMGTQSPGGGEIGGMTGEENGFMAMLNPDKEATITFTVTPEMVGTWTMGHQQPQPFRRRYGRHRHRTAERGINATKLRAFIPRAVL